MALVLSEDRNGWVEIMLNEPRTRNAITGPLGDELADAIRTADSSALCRLVLLRGADGAFCSGLNLKEFNREPAPAWLSSFQQTWRAVHTALYECRKPIVVALERFAINGGAALALAGDLLIVGDDSYLQVGEVRQGMAAPYNLAWLNLRFSEHLTAQLTLTGRRFTGTELHRLGIAYAAPPTSEVIAVASALCEELATFPSDALTTIKRTMRAYCDVPAHEWFDKATTNLPRARSKPRRVS
ncbi:MAG: enoyl-CoA hydratase/isomerase family protein [Gammaproteobacteria bacterium]|nr:enoyl-CoA hydratase/isomerase family protein [Gammaproteobacteria bacterium]